MCLAALEGAVFPKREMKHSEVNCLRNSDLSTHESPLSTFVQAGFQRIPCISYVKEHNINFVGE